jgi:Na+(H+)/acetate symporter ActP
LRLFLEPGWFAALLAWSFAVLTAAQLTIRLIMAFSIRRTVAGAIVLSLVALPVAAVYDLVVGPEPSLSQRLHWVPVPMVLMGLAGFGVARWLFRIKRMRGQIIAGMMVGLLAPHLFTLLS